MEKQWDEDWNAFVEHIALLIRNGSTTQMLKESFEGRKVRWIGTVKNVDIDELAPGVDLQMSEDIVDLGNGRTAPVGGLGLPITSDVIADWSIVQPGDSVLFEATIGSGNAIFPPIEVKAFESGRSVLLIAVCNGRLIERLKTG